MKKKVLLTDNIEKDLIAIESNKETVNKKLVSDIHLWDGESPLFDGVHKIEFNNVPFYFFIKISNQKQLYVSLTGGAGGRSRENGPFFSRWTYYPMAEGAFLCIDDPMVWEFGLHHGWFFGTKDTDYCRIVSKLIERIAKNQGIDLSNIIFYSSSSGGTASIRTSSFIGNNCICVSLNPQLDLKNDGYAKHVSSAIKYDITKDSKRTNILNIIKKRSDVRFFIISNIASKVDYDDLIKLKYRLKMPIKYGFTKANNTVVWAYKALHEHNHNAQDWREFFPIINFLINNYDLIESNKNIISIQEIATNQWYEHYEKQRKNNYKALKRSLYSDSADKTSMVKRCKNYYNSGCLEFGEVLARYYYENSLYKDIVEWLSDKNISSPDM